MRACYFKPVWGARAGASLFFVRLAVTTTHLGVFTFNSFENLTFLTDSEKKIELEQRSLCICIYKYI